MIRYAQNAFLENRMLDAAFYYRFAEFFCFSNEEDKQKLYWQFINLFYQVFGKIITVHYIPYEKGFLKAITFKLDDMFNSKNPHSRSQSDPIIVHGGGDSFIEEFFSMGYEMASDGYKVIMFEGPGQGEPLHKYNLKMTPEWEKPTHAILDFFKISSATIVGVSLGGYFAVRAAAFEPRIKKVILWDVVYDFFECVFGRNGKIQFLIIKNLVKLGAKGLINKIVEKQMKIRPEMKWIMKHSYFVNGVKTPFEYLKSLMRYTTAKISRQLTQKVLVMAGESDHIIPLRMYYKQLRALTHASLVSGRIFISSEEAAAHGQIGNLPLAFQEVFKWIEQNP